MFIDFMGIPIFSRHVRSPFSWVRPLLSCCTKALKENTTLQNLGVASTELGQTLGGTDGMGWDGLVVPGFHSNTADPLLKNHYFSYHMATIGVVLGL